MEYSIIRGCKQIGGTVTEMISSKGTRAWVDFGAALPGSNAKSSDEALISLMQDEKTRPDVVFFTHMHGDHMGLLSQIPDSVDIYLGEVASVLKDNINRTLLERAPLSKDEYDKLAREREILSNKDKVHFYKNIKNDAKSEYDHYKDISFKALRVDHSAFDSYMLRFEIDDKVLIHTGDFRAHGRLGENLLEDIDEYLIDSDKKVNYLITEGTMMSRPDSEVKTEEEMYKKAKDLLMENPNAFLVCSSTNLDSLSSFYWAAVHSTDLKKSLVCNSYIKSQLEVFTEMVGKAENDWRYKFYRSYSIADSLEKKFGGKKQIDHMRENGFLMMVGSSDYYLELMDKFKEEEQTPILIYSLWEGYLEEGAPYADEKLIRLVKSAEKLGYPVHRLHTSGHASTKTISSVISAIHPTEAIVPIHTENPEGFRALIQDNELKSLLDLKTDRIAA